MQRVPYGLTSGATRPCISTPVVRSRLTRTISLTQAIEKGKRKSRQSFIKHDSRYTNDAPSPPGDQLDPIRPSYADKHDFGRRRSQHERTVSSPSSNSKVSEPPAPIVDKIPFSSASSEFLFGAFSVLSALKAGRRRHLYNLYRLPASTSLDGERKPRRGESEEGSHYEDEGDGNQQILRRRIFSLAQQLNVDIKEMRPFEGKKIFDKLANGRPHSGLILEASPLPRLPITSLNPVIEPQGKIVVTASSTSREEREINNIFQLSRGGASIPSVRPAHRYPFMLFLDGVTNPGNFGAIIRSAWFLGVDAIIIPDHGTSPVSAVSVKASAGALEYMPILLVSDEKGFFSRSRESGWKFFAATLPTREESSLPPHILQVEGALLKHPCVLVLGNEHQGPRPFIYRFMDGTASITNARSHIGDVDSLNVGTAAALLAQRFLDSSRENGLGSRHNTSDNLGQSSDEKVF